MKAKLVILFGYFLIFSMSINKMLSQNNIMEKNNKFTPLQILTGDTLIISAEKSTSIMPGEIYKKFTQYQDSAYINALKLKIPNDSRFSNDLRQFLPQNKLGYLPSQKSIIDIINDNMNLPSKFFMPSGVDITLHNYNIMQSQYIPFVKTQQTGGMQLSLNSIALFFGLIEDTSPNINYKLDETSEIEIIIYSVQAVSIATIFKGSQIPGNYKITWNLRDDYGRLQPSGDYIAEVRIGKERYVRKRIYIP